MAQAERALAGGFSLERVCHRARRLALGLVVGLGSRTITRALGALVREQEPWSSDYRVGASPIFGVDGLPKTV
jgi:hypothetical protein